ncbi:MAG: integron [Pseudomonadota bacterium]
MSSERLKAGTGAMRIARFLVMVAALLLSGFGPAPAQEAAQVPVTVGGSAELDACGSLGRVVGLDPNGANALLVRAGPGRDYERLDRVGPGQILFLCGKSDRWHAVVYTAQGADCEVSKPIAAVQTYAGPCRAGWVFEAFVEPVAG